MTLNSETWREWRPVVGWDGFYEVSDIGEVRSLNRFVEYSNGRVCLQKGKLLKPDLGKRGYLKVALWKNSKRTRALVHMLVSRAFLGPIPPGFGVDHGDGNKVNNRVTNLEYVTGLENLSRSYEMGLHRRGERHFWSKLSDAEVTNIRKLRKQGLTQTEIAIKFGVCRQNVAAIVNGKSRRKKAVL